MTRLDGLARSIAERKAQKKRRAASGEVRFRRCPSPHPTHLTQLPIIEKYPAQTGGLPPGLSTKAFAEDTGPSPQSTSSPANGRLSPSQMLRGGLNPVEMLGPQGSFKKLNTSVSAVDLVRSKSYDTTSRLVSRCESETTLAPFPPAMESSHFASVERIGNSYTPTAKTLTMNVAKKVGDKQFLASPSKNSKKGRKKKPTVTAPAAYELSDQLQNSLNDMSDRGSDNFDFGLGQSNSLSGPFAISGSRGYNDKPFVPDQDSPQATRTRIRVQRSPPQMPIVAPVSNTPAYTLSQSQVNMDSWNPLVLGGAGPEEKVSHNRSELLFRYNFAYLYSFPPPFLPHAHPRRTSLPSRPFPTLPPIKYPRPSRTRSPSHATTQRSHLTLPTVHLTPPGLGRERLSLP